jgi:5-oxoprolinase (ATP-hydrolysing) subunit A
MARVIDFNCDLGEGVGDDAALMPFISSASIACGFHAGTPELMRETVKLCGEHGIAIGAHPSFADRENFGRIAQSVSPAEVYALTLYQIGALNAFVRAAGLRLNHVKPHGALYNLAARNRATADAVATAIRDHDADLILYGLAASALTDAGTAIGLQVVHEAFAERRYEADATLTPRSRADASIDDPADAVAQATLLLRDDVVIARTGERLGLHADSLCLHGDRSDAVGFARELRAAIEKAGFQVRAPEHRQ